jgi:hypothetical protein
MVTPFFIINRKEVNKFKLLNYFGERRIDLMKKFLISIGLLFLSALIFIPSLAIAQAKYAGSAKCMPCHKAI